jgi:hypothetical protein
VLANDSDADDGDLLSIISTGVPDHGTAVEVGGLIRYTPPPDFNGTDTFTYTISDGELSDVATVTVTVIAVNDAPTFTAGADIEVDEDCGPQTVPGWATDMSPGPVDETAQLLTFGVAADDEEMFAVLPAIDAATGDLTFTPADDAHGVAALTVTLQDDGGTANDGEDTSAPHELIITVHPVNDAPTITDIVNQRIIVGTVTVGPLSFTVGDIETTADDLIVWAESSNQDLVPDDAIVLGGSGAARTLTITLPEGAIGTAEIIIYADDETDITSTRFTLTVSVREIWCLYAPTIMA